MLLLRCCCVAVVRCEVQFVCVCLPLACLFAYSCLFCFVFICLLSGSLHCMYDALSDLSVYILHEVSKSNHPNVNASQLTGHTHALHKIRSVYFSLSLSLPLTSYLAGWLDKLKPPPLMRPRTYLTALFYTCGWCGPPVWYG